MTYLFSGLALSCALMFAMFGKFLFATLLFLFSVWLFNWSRRTWGDDQTDGGFHSGSGDGVGDADE